MKFSDLNNTEVAFKDCPVHTELRYAGDVCPVCVAHELLRQKAKHIEELELDLEERDRF